MGVYFNGTKKSVCLNLVCGEATKALLRREHFEEVEGGYKAYRYSFAYTPVITDERYFSDLYGVDKTEVLGVDQGTFTYCPNLVTMDLPNCTTIGSGTLSNCSLLKSVYLPAVGEVKAQAFSNCPLLETIDLSGCSVVSAMGAFSSGNLINLLLGRLTSVGTNAFRNATTLINITIGEGTTADLNLQFCENLTQASLHAMIDNLADLTGGEQGYFSVGEENLLKISNEYKNKLEQKNWNYG